MDRKKLVLFITIIISLSVSLFALPTSEARLMYLPYNVVNNSGVMVDLNLTTTRFNYSSLTKDFNNSNASSNNLGVFRIMDSLLYSKQPAANGGTGNDKDIQIYINAPEGFYFVHDDNPTSRVEFSLAASYIQGTNNGRGTINYGNSTALTGNVGLGDKNATASLVKSDETTYVLTVPTTDYNVTKVDYQWFFDIFIVLKSDADLSVLDSGVYSANFTVTSDPFNEYKDGSTVVSTNKTLNESITVKAYLGIDPVTSNEVYAYTVSSARDTYNMDLKLESQSDSQAYDIASITFYHTIVDSTFRSDNPENANKGKFKIYISPARDYKATAGDYFFVKMGTENQSRTDANTVWYDLYLNDNGTLVSFNNTTNYTSRTDISSSGKSSTGSYYMVPAYSQDEIETSGWTNRKYKYKQSWTLVQDLYLKVSGQSLGKDHASGLYYSYIYVTLEYN